MTKCKLIVEDDPEAQQKDWIPTEREPQEAWIPTELAIKGKELKAKGRNITVDTVGETKQFSERTLDGQEGVVEQYWKMIKLTEK